MITIGLGEKLSNPQIVGHLSRPVTSVEPTRQLTSNLFVRTAVRQPCAPQFLHFFCYQLNNRAASMTKHLTISNYFECESSISRQFFFFFSYFFRLLRNVCAGYSGAFRKFHNFRQRMWTHRDRYTTHRYERTLAHLFRFGGIQQPHINKGIKNGRRWLLLAVSMRLKCHL